MPYFRVVMERGGAPPLFDVMKRSYRHDHASLCSRRRIGHPAASVNRRFTEAAIPIYQKPLITFALDHLVDLGVESFVINTHHLA